MNIILDIETKPNEKLIELFTSRIKAPKTYKDENKIKAYIEEKKVEAVKGMSVDIDYAEIKLIGIKIDEEPAKIITLEELISFLNEHIEVKSETITEFVNRVIHFNLITFNGKKFDLPIIIRECIRQKLDAPLKDLKGMCKRFQTGAHIDLMELINETDYKSLDLYSQIYLGESKKDIDFSTCSDEELKEHCLEDIELTYRLFNLFKKLI